MEVSPTYFATMGIPLLAGRTFSAFAARAGDSLRVREIILSRSAARRVFGENDPLGKDVQCCFDSSERWTIIGIAADTKIRHLRESRAALVYAPMEADVVEGLHMFVVVRSILGAAGTHAVVDSVVAKLAPGVPVEQRISVRHMVRAQFGEERRLFSLIGLLASIAIGLAVLGLYAVTSYGMAQRRREIAIRVALGARRSGLIQLLGRQSAWLVSIGVTLGAFGSFLLARMLQARLYGVGSSDAFSLLFALLLVMAAASVACAIPIRHAMSVDPVKALGVD
jgi:hypothetical protein